MRLLLLSLACLLFTNNSIFTMDYDDFLIDMMQNNNPWILAEWKDIGIGSDSNEKENSSFEENPLYLYHAIWKAPSDTIKELLSKAPKNALAFQMNGQSLYSGALLSLRDKKEIQNIIAELQKYNIKPTDKDRKLAQGKKFILPDSNTKND